MRVLGSGRTVFAAVVITGDAMPLKSFRSVIELWPTRVALAAELGLEKSAVSKWWQRDFVPPNWWTALVKTETARNAGVTEARLAVLARERIPA